MNEDNLNQRLKGFISSAVSNLAGKNYNEAVNELKAALVLDKNNPEILYNLGVAHARMGLHKTALENFNTLLSSGSGFAEESGLKKLIAYCYISLNEFNQALAAIEEALKFHHADTAALNMKGYCLEHTGKLKEAWNVYSQIIEIDPENYTACNSLAYVMAKNSGSLESALAMAKRACSHDKNNGAYLDTVGYIYLKMGDITRALKFFRHAKLRLPFSSEIDDHIREAENINSLINSK